MSGKRRVLSAGELAIEQYAGWQLLFGGARRGLGSFAAGGVQYGPGVPVHMGSIAVADSRQDVLFDVYLPVGAIRLNEKNRSPAGSVGAPEPNL